MKANELNKKIPDTATLIHINQYNTDKLNLEEKLVMLMKTPDVRGLVTAAVLNTKISGLGKKTDYDAKISEIEKKILDHNYTKYIAAQEFNKLTADTFAARLKHANLATKYDVDDFVKKKVLMIN